MSKVTHRFNSARHAIKRMHQRQVSEMLKSIRFYAPKFHTEIAFNLCICNIDEALKIARDAEKYIREQNRKNIVRLDSRTFARGRTH